MSVDLLEALRERRRSEPGSKRRFAKAAIIELAVSTAGYVVYSLSCGAVRGHERLAFENAGRVVHLERSLGLLTEHQLQSVVLPHTAILQLFNGIYMWGHLPLIVAVAVWMFLFHRAQYPLVRNAVLLSGAIALLVFYGFPVAPPRLVPALHLVDTAALISPVYDAVEPKVFFNPYAAMPSMHIGWDLLMGLALLWCSRYLVMRWIGVLLPIAMLFAVIITGNHYVIDGIAGAFVGLAGLAAALGLEGLKVGHGVTMAGSQTLPAR